MSVSIPSQTKAACGVVVLVVRACGVVLLVVREAFRNGGTNAAAVAAAARNPPWVPLPVAGGPAEN
jgi:hypothetical protein